MAAIELTLIAAMLDRGDLAPINNGMFKEGHCLTEEGKALHSFLSNYHFITNGAGRVPNRDIIQNRFGGLLLPPTTGAEDLGALAHEVRTTCMKASLRSMAEELSVIAGMPDPVMEAAGLRKKMDKALEDVSSSDDLSFSGTLEEIVGDYASGNILPRGMPWPWPVLNSATQGIHPQEFYVIAGRPKSRKTFVALAVAAHAFMNGARVVFVSPEMPCRQIMLRFTATCASLRYMEFKTGELTQEEELRLVEVAKKFGHAPPVIREMVEDTGSNTIAMNEPAFIVTKGAGKGIGYIRAKIQQHRPHLVIVDSFYRLEDDRGGRKDADWKTITNISRGMKDMAMIENIPIIGTHQLNRKSDEGVGSLANLALSDSVGQDGDLILRVITAKRKAGDKSALVVLGGRETPIEGVLIHNQPCANFTEIAPITNRKVILNMLMEEDDVEAEEPAPTTEKPNGHRKGKKTLAGIYNPV